MWIVGCSYIPTRICVYLYFSFTAIQLKFIATYYEVEEGDLIAICIEMEDPVDPVCPYDGQFDVNITTANHQAGM